MPSTPLYKRLKSNGSTFYAFPSTSMHPNPNFTKFVLLNIPNKIEDERLDFELENFNGTPFEIYTDNISPTNKYSEKLIESLRNYVANHDTIMRDTRVSTNKDFYNIDEKQTATEIIFWKWLRKMGAIDFEVAEHGVDWDKNLDDFDNPNADTITNTDYFRKYLWKEREVIEYNMEFIEFQGVTTYSNDTVRINISYAAKFREGDKIILSGDGLGELTTGITYDILGVDEVSQTETDIYIEDPNVTSDVVNPNGYLKLDYHKVIQYIGEINVKSDVRTARLDETEVTAYIPHQAGRTPTVLFTIRDDSNYFPGVELPILPTQIQTEIKGAENLESPIRQNPSDYPGLYYGQFDTSNKTYMASSGDKIRYSGDYFGINRINNVGLDADNYIELLSEFDSTNIDGLNLDFDLNHYLKMSITDQQIGFNFDEFNQATIDGEIPQDFEYNAILWYYELEGDDINDSNIYSNIYGITFLNNPENDDDSDDTLITPYQKLVSNDEHDGLSYIHTLNISTSVDNDTSSLSFDPLSVNNTFGFDLYQNVMSNMAKLNESFVNIISTFTKLNEELNNVKSIVYTQTDIDLIKSKLKNLEELLKLYEKYQFVDSDTVSITTNYGGVYPTLSFNIKNVEYSSIYNITTTDIFDYKTATGEDYTLEVPDSNKMLIKITNDDITNYGTMGVVLDKDLSYRQSVEFHIDANNGFYSNLLNLSIKYDDGINGVQQMPLINNIYSISDIGNYIPGDITYNKSYYNNTTISQNVNLTSPTGTTPLIYTLVYPTEQNLIGSLNYEDKVYIDNFKFFDNETSTVVDYSGMYNVGTTESDFNQMYFRILLNTYNKDLITIPKVHLIKAMKIEIIRIDNSNISSLNDRYLIQKTFL